MLVEEREDSQGEVGGVEGVARVEAASAAMGRLELKWLEADQAAHWETRVAERMSAISLMREAAAPSPTPAASILSAGELLAAKGHRWLADPEARQWSSAIAERLETISLVQRSLGDRVSAPMLQGAQVVVEDAAPWLAEAAKLVADSKEGGALIKAMEEALNSHEKAIMEEEEDELDNADSDDDEEVEEDDDDDEWGENLPWKAE